MERISKELIGASVTPIILTILRDEDSYGYEIIQKVKALSDNRIEWKDGSLYPVLKRLEEQGMVESYWKVEKTVRPRKYYKLLSTGQEALMSEKQEWELIFNVFGKLWNMQSNLT